jgi:outer membrane receptor protein involved in Fe transport
MKTKALALVIAAGQTMCAMAAYAQTSTTGAIKGVIVDAAGNEPVAGAVVVASSPAMQGTQTELTDNSGAYFFSSLPPGSYEVHVYYNNGRWARGNIAVPLGKVVGVNIAIDLEKAGSSETIRIDGRAPVIDQGSTKTGVVIDDEYTRNIPTGRTFLGVLGAAAGSQGDDYGISFGGATSAENMYVIEGVNVTDNAYGGAVAQGGGETTTSLPNEFVRETEVITGGYNAEYGRATGAVVNVVTKSGGNEFHGSLFGYYTPGQLSPQGRALPSEGSSIVGQSELDYLASFGAEVGGPIIKDRLWFHVGANPVVTGIDVHRIVNSFVDEDGDGVPDRDPSTGFSRTREVDRTELRRASTQYLFHGKLSFALSPEHQGALAVFGSPGTRDVYRTVTGPQHAGLVELEDGAADVSGKWTSKFNNNRTQLDAVVGAHRNRLNEVPKLAGGSAPMVRFDYEVPLSTFGALEPGGAVPEACRDGGANDPFPMITNCPVRFYNAGGVGSRDTQTSDRLSAALKLTQRVQAAGHHQFKVGADVEDNRYDKLTDYTSGSIYTYNPNDVRVRRLYTVSDSGDVPCGEDFDGDGQGDARCAFQPHGLRSDTRTQNLAAFVQDEWSVRPNVTVNAGLRWEQQTAYYADHLRGSVSALTGEPIPDVAFALKNMFAPRVGAIYDWTEEGRSKAYGHWGRYYESVPLDINARAYGGEVLRISRIPTSQCTEAGQAVMGPGDASCNLDAALSDGLLATGSGALIVPRLKPQYLDEFVAGIEYELFENFKVGSAYIHRELGRVIEDVSLDGGNTYILANPGEAVAASDIAALRSQARLAEAAGNMERAGFLRSQADSFEKVDIFDPPTRTYDALQLSASKRFSSDFMMLASYTFSKTRGNFPGLFSPETGQLDPNLTSMYDLPELMANRYGDLPHDKPHLLKVDGYYVQDAGELGQFTFGLSGRAGSGRPVNVLGAHSMYGFGESYILPRGAGGRTELTTQLDARLIYGRNIGSGQRIEAFVDLLNLLNTQTTTGVDEDYTYEDVNPIVGGDRGDLAHLKAIDPTTGRTSSALASKNPNYGNPTADQAVFSARLGIRLTF